MAFEATAHEEIRPIPQARRTLGPLQFGVLWGDLGVGLLILVAGGLLVPSLGLKTALFAIVVGSVIGSALLALAGKVGSDLGVPTMVALRPSLGIRGSYVASLLNIGQLIGWAGLEIIIMSQAAEAISGEYFGFGGYYLWLTLFAVAGTAFAVAGPVVVVRQFLERFGVWIVIAASAWLTWRLWDAYDFSELWNREGTGGWPGFWLAVDLAVSLPVSWLPLVADYSRYARNGRGAMAATFASYTVANVWFFFLGAAYVLALYPAGEFSPGNTLVLDLVDSLLPLALGWVFLFVILVDEMDNAFANIYSTAVSLQNLVRIGQRTLAALVGLAALVFAISVDLAGYETFLLLIGGVFVSLFGVMCADYFVNHGQRYETDELYRQGGRYWFVGGVNLAGMLAWGAGFVVYAACGQPPWLVEHASWIADVPSWMTEIGGTIPSFVVSFLLYLALSRVSLPAGQPIRQAEAGEGAGS
ncbi:MAG TPA: cytosine permease [Dehalococcoidia bacterium]|nr:cytosine permease [Dehalococcoidia bacterium]